MLLMDMKCVKENFLTLDNLKNAIYHSKLVHLSKIFGTLCHYPGKDEWRILNPIDRNVTAHWIGFPLKQ